MSDELFRAVGVGGDQSHKEMRSSHSHADVRLASNQWPSTSMCSLIYKIHKSKSINVVTLSVIVEV